MALNKFMHPRNIYKTRKPDFAQLALDYPAFQKHITQDLSGKVYVDFKNPESLRALTLTLLQHDFSLTVELPLDRLIPTVPLRLNYIHWLEDILSDTVGIVKGIDIGTGSSCIYPLLSCRLNPKWMFQATDVDTVNIEHASKNVVSNGLQEHITVRQVSGGSILLETVQEGSDERQFDFCMCNPPFFADHMDAQAIMSTRSDERPDPSSVSTAHEVESIVRGGEVSFVNRMIAESVKLLHIVRVYSTMIGKKSSIALIKDELRRCQVPCYATTEFCQGKTMRWGIAWSFDVTVKFPKSTFQEKHKEKPPLTFKIPNTGGIGVVYELIPLAENIKDILTELQIDFEEIKTSKDWLSIEVRARQNTWSHQRRKRRQIKRDSLASANSAQILKGTSDIIVEVPMEHSNPRTDISCHVQSNQITETVSTVDHMSEVSTVDHMSEVSTVSHMSEVSTVSHMSEEPVKSEPVPCKGAGDGAIVRLPEPSSLLNDTFSNTSSFEDIKATGNSIDLDNVINSVSLSSKTENKNLALGQNGYTEDGPLIDTHGDELQTCQIVTCDVEAQFDNGKTDHSSKKRTHEDMTSNETDSKINKIINNIQLRSDSDAVRTNDGQIMTENSVINIYPGTADGNKLVTPSSNDADIKVDALAPSGTSCSSYEQIQNEGQYSGNCANTVTQKNNSNTVCNKVEVSCSSDITSNVGTSSGIHCTETEYLFRSILTLKKVLSSYIIEMSWMDGKNRELMHQLFLYFKNKFN